MGTDEPQNQMFSYLSPEQPYLPYAESDGSILLGRAHPISMSDGGSLPYFNPTWAERHPQRLFFAG
ncbi:MAG TPA: hypothetical protein VF783_03960 [Terriglobales bacterium]